MNRPAKKQVNRGLRQRVAAGMGIIALSLTFSITCCDLGACGQSAPPPIESAAGAHGDCHGQSGGTNDSKRHNSGQDSNQKDCGNCQAKNAARSENPDAFDLSRRVLAVEPTIIVSRPNIAYARLVLILPELFDMPPPASRHHAVLQTFLI